MTAIESQPQTAIALRSEFSVAEVVAQAKKIQEVLRAVMKDGEHYGVIPGTGSKPTLLKPGAEKLCLTFRMDPQYEIVSKTEQAEQPWHSSYTIRCVLFHIPTGMRLGSGMGSASTREPKWGEVNQQRTCPTCSLPTIIKGKDEYGGGWVCFKKKGGCGAKFNDGDASIEDQKTGKVWRDNLAEVNNTVLKMGCKRALIAAVLNVTAASDIFTQDIEDLSDVAADIKQAEARDEKPAAGPKLATEAQRKRLWAILKSSGKSEQDFKRHLAEVYGLESGKDIQAKDYEAICDWAKAGGTREPGEDDDGAALSAIPL